MQRNKLIDKLIGLVYGVCENHAVLVLNMVQLHSLWCSLLNFSLSGQGAVRSSSLGLVTCIQGEGEQTAPWRKMNRHAARFFNMDQLHTLWCSLFIFSLSGARYSPSAIGAMKHKRRTRYRQALVVQRIRR